MLFECEQFIGDERFIEATVKARREYRTSAS